VRIFVAFFVLLASPMTFDDLVKPAWKKLSVPRDDLVWWDPRVAPPLPSEWPMTPKGTLVRWVYAAGRDMNLSDGERVAAPWARIDLSAEGARNLTTLSSALEPFDTQGVRPVSKAEVEVLGQLAEAEASLRKNDLDAVKAGYCAWRSMNGTIAQRIEPKHAAFFKALRCGR
jgi:hypothetical protein